MSGTSRGLCKSDWKYSGEPRVDRTVVYEGESYGNQQQLQKITSFTFTKKEKKGAGHFFGRGGDAILQ